MTDTTICRVDAAPGFADNGQTAVIATVYTKGGAVGQAACSAGLSMGDNEAPYLFDGGSAFHGMGVQKAADSIRNVLGPALVGQDSVHQCVCDEILLSFDKKTVGTNAMAALSCAVLKASANALDVPLYKQLGGVRAFTIPLPAYLGASGSNRYGGSECAGYQPNYYFIAYDFDDYSQATAALWEVLMNWEDYLRDFLGVKMTYTTGIAIPKGCLENDWQLWEMMAEIIDKTGFAGKIGIHVDMAATCFYDKESGLYQGLFSSEPKTREEMIETVVEMAKKYPFVIIEDPLHDQDFEGFAEITRRTDIQILGDDLYGMNLERLKKGISMGAGNAVRIDVAQIGTITETSRFAQYAYEHGFGLYGGAERGAGWDSCDYAVGFNCSTAQNIGLYFGANRLMEIESQLGGRARFFGKRGLYGRRFQL